MVPSFFSFFCPFLLLIGYSLQLHAAGISAHHITYSQFGAPCVHIFRSETLHVQCISLTPHYTKLCPSLGFPPWPLSLATFTTSSPLTCRAAESVPPTTTTTAGCAPSLPLSSLPPSLTSLPYIAGVLCCTALSGWSPVDTLHNPSI